MPSQRRPRRPYKFLSPYGINDDQPFVARERETETLLSDVITSRLVVLFAPTGTGKTSLINAGVRPRLEELSYSTFHFRVERDPIEAVRRAMCAAGLMTRELRDERLPDQLRAASTALAQPIVLFFDQFEEFFIQSRGLRNGAFKTFIDDVAELYRDAESGIHSVFSMREEFFVELDAFREQIPSIFHNESNLRLRPFERDQALRAIVAPAEAVDVELEDGLAERIVDDLEQDGLVSPPGLQIVCDTLWQQSDKRRLRIDQYERLGGAGQVFSRRLAQSIADLPDEQLALLERLIPELRTEQGTKYTRGLAELSNTLEADPKLLQALVDALNEKHLLSRLVIGRDIYVEWASDYLAARTQDLRTSARLTRHRRMLADAVKRAKASPVLPLRANAFEEISADVAELEIDADTARRGLVTALWHRTAAQAWTARAQDAGMDVWTLFRTLMGDEDQPDLGVSVIRLLGALPDAAESVELLREAVDEPRLAPPAFDALTQQRTERATSALADVIREAGDAPPAIDALRRMGTPAAIDALTDAAEAAGSAGVRAASALGTLAGDPADLERAKAADEALQRALDRSASAIFLAALEHGLQARFWFERAREHGVDAWKILRAALSGPVERGEAAVKLLAVLEDAQAGKLLRRAARQPGLRDAARDALRARGEILPASDRGRDRAPEEERSEGLGKLDWKVLLDRIAQHMCVPLLGSGLSPTRPGEIARRWAYENSVPAGRSTDLAAVSEYMSVQFDAAFVQEALRQELTSIPVPDLSDPREPYRVLAQLPLTLYVTTNFDDFMEQALTHEAKEPTSHSFDWRNPDRAPPDEAVLERAVERPLVFHLHGHAAFPESIVLTETDQLDFLTSFGDAFPLIKSELVSATWLALGYGPEDWAWRFTLRGLLRSLPHYARRTIVAALWPPPDPAELQFAQRRAETEGIRVFWSSAADFAAELGARWNKR